MCKYSNADLLRKAVEGMKKGEESGGGGLREAAAHRNRNIVSGIFILTIILFFVCACTRLT